MHSGWRVLVIWECALKGKTRRNLNEVIHTTANWLLYDSQSAEIEGKK
jgi:DNA mismatch endonuclease (patch repair protein)